MLPRKRPAVDIIIPFHGCYEYVTKCIEGIFRCTPNQDYKIILVDDGSDNKSYTSVFTNHKKVKIVALNEHKGYGAAVAKGYEESSNPWIVLMHSDVYVINYLWLLNLQRVMSKFKEDGVKFVSSKPNVIGTAKEYDERITTCTEDFIAEKPVPLFCSLIHRDLFKVVGNIKNYKYAGNEDEEYFYRMKKSGYKQVVCASSLVHHEGGATINNLCKNVHYKNQIKENRKICDKDIELLSKLLSEQ